MTSHDEYRPDRRDMFPAALRLLAWSVGDALTPLADWFRSLPEQARQ